ncbi:1-acyl-sn-glycerol-3-phosphate acyltransferase delta-like isoform X1 [Amblyomma americanum]
MSSSSTTDTSARFVKEDEGRSTMPQRLWSAVKTNLLCHTFFTLTFLSSGLVLNVLQLFVYCLVRPFSRHLYRRINYYLIYASWSQVVALAQWWSGSRIIVWGTDEDLEALLKDHHMCVMNHSFEVDWLVCWMICDQFKMLANAKTFAKKSLMYVPVIGWNWALSEIIFLERSWEKDSKTIGSKLDLLLDYKDKILLLMFSEGTRFNKAKHELSLEFAAKRNLPKLKHHLLPRPKGFVYCTRHFKERGSSAVYDVQLGFKNSPNLPTIKNVLNGRPFLGDLYFRRVPLDNVPIDSDEECTKFLYDLYVEKDKEMDDYLKTGKFPGTSRELPVRIWPLVVLCIWSAIVAVPCLYAFYAVLTSGSTFTVVAFSTFFALLFSVLHWMVGLSEIKKSSKYGTTDRASSHSDGDKPRENGVAVLRKEPVIRSSS